MSQILTGFLSGRFCGAFAGIETKLVPQTGQVKSIATFMTTKGKKYRFVIQGDVESAFELVPPFSVIVVDLVNLEIGKPGEYGNYGDQNFTAESIKLVQSNVAASADNRGKDLGPILAEKKAA